MFVRLIVSSKLLRESYLASYILVAVILTAEWLLWWTPLIVVNVKNFMDGVF